MNTLTTFKIFQTIRSLNGKEQTILLESCPDEVTTCEKVKNYRRKDKGAYISVLKEVVTEFIVPEETEAELKLQLPPNFKYHDGLGFPHDVWPSSSVEVCYRDGKFESGDGDCFNWGRNPAGKSIILGYRIVPGGL